MSDSDAPRKWLIFLGELSVSDSAEDLVQVQGQMRRALGPLWDRWQEATE